MHISINKSFAFRLVISLTALAIGWLIAPTMGLKQSNQNAVARFDTIRNWANIVAILWTNLKVSILLSVLGYFTAGLCSVLVLMWNGMLLKLSVSVTIAMHPGISVADLIIQYFPHAFTELTALMLFASIGLGGYSFFKSMYNKTTFKFPSKATVHTSIIAFGLLILSSIIEVYG